MLQLQVGMLAGGQVVQHAHGITPRQQGVGQVGADEAGTAGDQYRGIIHDESNDPVKASGPCARRAA
ncbi:hypothetical protein D3C77_717730 [compost metagenome]